MSFPTINDYWEIMSKRLFEGCPPPPEDLLEITEAFFYGGVKSMFIVINASDDSSDIAAYMEAWEKELEEFTMSKGRRKSRDAEDIQL